VYRKATVAQKKELCELFGNYSSQAMQPKEVDNFLMTKAEQFPNRIVSYFDPKSKEDTVLSLEIEELKHFKVIFRSRSGYFKFGSPSKEKSAIALGRTEEKVKEYLTNPDNYEVVEQMRMVLQEKKDSDEK
jgi:hypothetical protein